jgi:hypothetical protein
MGSMKYKKPKGKIMCGCGSEKRVLLRGDDYWSICYPCTLKKMQQYPEALTKRSEKKDLVSVTKCL